MVRIMFWSIRLAAAIFLLVGLAAPADVARTARFLCGPGARYMTGQTLHVNGGAFLG